MSAPIDFSDILINLTNNQWQVCPKPRSLTAGDVDLWRVDLGRDPASIDSLFEVLSSDEKQRADKYVFAKDRCHFIAGRAALREILGGYLAVSPERIGISTRKYGKPYLTAMDNDLRFNVSHSNGVAVIAVSMKREVGIDIEFVDRNFDVFGVAPSVFSSAEVSRIRSLPLDLQSAAFFAAWARKEAFLKAMGDGLCSSEELQRAVSLISDEEGSFSAFENNTFIQWSLTSFQLDDDFKAALVVEGGIVTIRYCKLMKDEADCTAQRTVHRDRSPFIGIV